MSSYLQYYSNNDKINHVGKVGFIMGEINYINNSFKIIEKQFKKVNIQKKILEKDKEKIEKKLSKKNEITAEIEKKHLKNVIKYIAMATIYLILLNITNIFIEFPYPILNYILVVPSVALSIIALTKKPLKDAKKYVYARHHTTESELEQEKYDLKLELQDFKKKEHQITNDYYGLINLYNELAIVKHYILNNEIPSVNFLEIEQKQDIINKYNIDDVKKLKRMIK